jgi:hypothetical protein
MDGVFIVFGQDSLGNRYYISNTDPLIWTPNLYCAQQFHSILTMCNEITHNYDNYHSIKRMINSGTISSLWFAQYEDDYEISIKKVM